jgi:flagellar biosynthesis chaperone FliJ
VQWRSARARSQSLERLGDRLAAQAAEHDARVEQRQLDEIASRRKV